MKYERKISMKKFGQYYVSLFKKYGVLIPIVIVALLFVALLFMDKNNVFTSLLNSSKAGFIVLAIVGIVIVLSCGTLVVIKVKNTEVTVVDLCLEMVSALSLVLLISFCFEPGEAKSVVTILKWVITAVLLIGSLAISYVRARLIEE